MSDKIFHEFRDPIHNFLHVDDDERRVIDSLPVQRLRKIHQLAMSYMVYPGATHTRFEHSLGVMELAARVFEIVTNPVNVLPAVREHMSFLDRGDQKDYWKRVLRMASLCHDVGHLPFSHAAEHDLLPTGWSHETLTAEVIKSAHMKRVWEEMTPPLRTDNVVKMAVGPKKLPSANFSVSEAVLTEILVGDEFGVDRIDYLLRDSLHAGVAYGKFDHFRLIETLRILPDPDTGEPKLGVESGGLHAAEALALARYFMFTQVYLHPVRRAFDIHLKDFMLEWLPSSKYRSSKYPTDVDEHLEITDVEVLAAMAVAARNPGSPGSEPAKRIIERNHFRVLWEWSPRDAGKHPNTGQLVYDAAIKEFGAEVVRHDSYSQEAPYIDFPVLTREKTILYARELSNVLANLPPLTIDYVFVAPEILSTAQQWQKTQKTQY